MKRHLILPVIGCALLFTGCIGTHYTNIDAPSTLMYLYEESEQNLSNLSKRYGSTLNRTVKEETPKPGACADYGVVLAKQNKAEEANEWFNKEAKYYPSSIPYINHLKKTMTPAFAHDTIAYKMEDLKKKPEEKVEVAPGTDSTATKKNFSDKVKDTWGNIKDKFSKKEGNEATVEEGKKEEVNGKETPNKKSEKVKADKKEVKAEPKKNNKEKGKSNQKKSSNKKK